MVLVCLIGSAIAFAANVATNPNIGGAPAAVKAIDRSHGSSAVMVAPSDRIAQALVASEDSTFYSNNGVDDVALVRAFWGFLTGHDLGGSTIEMQLAHVLYPCGDRWLLGPRPSRLARPGARYPLHEGGDPVDVSVGRVLRPRVLRYRGCEPRVFRGCALLSSSWAQAALLAGMVQAPSVLDPFRHLAAAEGANDVCPAAPGR